LRKKNFGPSERGKGGEKRNGDFCPRALPIHRDGGGGGKKLLKFPFCLSFSSAEVVSPRKKKKKKNGRFSFILYSFFLSLAGGKKKKGDPL